MTNDERRMYREIMPIWLKFVQANTAIRGRPMFRAWLHTSKFKPSYALCEKIEANLCRSFLEYTANLCANIRN